MSPGDRLKVIIKPILNNKILLEIFLLSTYISNRCLVPTLDKI